MLKEFIDHTPNVINAYDIASKIYKTDPFEYREFFENTFPIEQRANMHVLVLGCGPADDVDYIQNQGFSVIGMDISSGMVQEAKKRHPNAAVFEMDMRNVSLLDEEQWDIVCLPYSLFHVPKEHLPRLFSGISRILKPNGHIYFTTQESRDGAPLETFSRREDDGGDLYMNVETEESLTALLNKAGFNVLHSQRRAPDADEHQFYKLTMVAEKL